MRIIEDHQISDDLPQGMVLSIGNFDGMHRGHQTLIATARQIAREKETQVAAMTFDPHPAVLLYPDRAPGILSPLVMKTMLLESLSVDYLIVCSDTKILVERRVGKVDRARNRQKFMFLYRFGMNCTRDVRAIRNLQESAN